MCVLCRIRRNNLILFSLYIYIYVHRSDTESAGRYSRSEVDGASSQGQRRSRINLSRLFGRNKDKVSGADTDTMKTVVTIDDEKVIAAIFYVDDSFTIYHSFFYVIIISLLK